MLLQLFSRLAQTIVRFWQARFGTQRLPSLSSLVWLVGLAIAALALWGFFELAEEVLEQETLALDRSVLLFLQQYHTAWLTQLAIAVTWIGEPAVLLGLCTILGFFSLWQRRWAEATTLFVGAGGAIGLNTWLKDIFSRARPELWDRIVDVNYYSFPSGHAMVSLIIYGLVGYWLSVRLPQFRTAITAGLVLLVVAIGLSRLYLGVHWPTDVMAGYAAGTVWLVANLLSLNILKYRAAQKA